MNFKAVQKVNKIAVSLAVVVGGITWALVSFIPAFKHGLPVSIAAAIPAIVSLIAHYFGYSFAAKRESLKLAE